MKIIYSLLILITSNLSYSQLIPFNYEQDEKLQLIFENLPAGWTIQWQTDTLIFKREGEVYSLYENKINAPINFETVEEFEARVKAQGSIIKAKIKVKLYPRWTIEQFANANTHNSQIISQMLELQSEYDIIRLRRESPHSKSGFYFIPETGDDEDRIRMYQIKKRELERGLINIPDLHSEHYSYFIIEVHGAEDEYVSISPKEASDEVYEILNLLESTLQKFK